MSINIETPVGDDTLQSLDPLRVTTDAMHLHRIWVEVKTVEQWYDCIRQANSVFGARRWRGQSHVRRKLARYYFDPEPIWIWFDVPDASFATWISVKLGVRVKDRPNK